MNDVPYLNGQGYSSEPALDTYRLLGVAPEGIQLEVSVPVVEAGRVAEIEVRFTNLQTSPVDLVGLEIDVKPNERHEDGQVRPVGESVATTTTLAETVEP